MWENVDKTIQKIESRMNLVNQKTDLYHTKFCSQDNDGCSLKYSRIIGEFMPMENKKHDFLYGFKFQCTSINESFSKLEGFSSFKTEE